MALRSYNGWSVGTASMLSIKSYRVPGTSVYVTLRPVAAPILLWIGSQVDQRVANIDVSAGHRTPDDWGYAYRYTRGAYSWSNHASGTAVDFNATQWPRTLYRMTNAQVAECRQILAEVNHAAGKRIVDWGGNYRAAVIDQMHWELAYGVSSADVSRAVANLTHRGTLDLSRLQWAATHDVKAGKATRPVATKELSSALNEVGLLKKIYVGGRFTERKRRQYAEWQVMCGAARGSKAANGVPGAGSLQRLATRTGRNFHA